MTMMYHIDDCFACLLLYPTHLNICFSHTGLGKGTTREDQMEMTYTKLMCLIFGWNSVTRYDFNCGFMPFYSYNAFLLCPFYILEDLIMHTYNEFSPPPTPPFPLPHVFLALPLAYVTFLLDFSFPLMLCE